MAEYVSKDILLKAVEKMDRLDKESTPYEYNKDGYILLIENAPTEDVEEVVRCKHCSYRKTHICAITGAKTLFCDYWDKPYPIEEEHYCGYGTRTPKERGGEK